MKDEASGWILLSAGGLREVIADARAAADWPSRDLTLVGGANVFAADARAAAEQAAREAFEAGRVQFVTSLDALMQSAIMGTRDEVLERFAEMDEWGVNYLRLTFSDLGQQTYFAERVLPHVDVSASASLARAEA